MYPKNGQSVAEPAELVPDVVEAVVVNVGAGADGAGEADFPPLQAVAASPTKPIRTVRLTNPAALVKMRSTMTGRSFAGIEGSRNGNRRLAELSVFPLALRLTGQE